MFAYSKTVRGLLLMEARRKAYRRSSSGGGSGFQVGEKAYPSPVVLEADNAQDGADGESKRPHPAVSLRLDVDIAEKKEAYRQVGGLGMRGYMATEVYKCVNLTPAPAWRVVTKTLMHGRSYCSLSCKAAKTSSPCVVVFRGGCCNLCGRVYLSWGVIMKSM